MNDEETKASDVASRVARGVALLDEVSPDWWRTLDLSRLRMSSPCRCVLGQTFGSPDDTDMTTAFWSTGFGKAAGRFAPVPAGLGSPWAEEHGFDRTQEEYDAEEEVDNDPEATHEDVERVHFLGYDALSREWTRVVLARRAAEVSP